MTIRRKMVEKTKLSIAASFLYAFAIKLALIRASLVAQMVKNLPAMQETHLQCKRHIPGSERSPGGANGYPLQYSWPGESFGQRSLAGCSLWDLRVRYD